MRLIEDTGRKHVGRLEIEADGVVGCICDSSWFAADARVACQQLGYADGDSIR